MSKIYHTKMALLTTGILVLLLTRGSPELHSKEKQ